MNVRELPKNYSEWQVDRQRHLVRDLSYSKHTALLYEAYRRHLGMWRYYLLLEVQAVLVPDEVRQMLSLRPKKLMTGLAQTYGVLDSNNLQSLVHTLLIPRRYWSEIKGFERS